jgi:hypothetical protein
MSPNFALIGGLLFCKSQFVKKCEISNYHPTGPTRPTRLPSVTLLAKESLTSWLDPQLSTLKKTPRNPINFNVTGNLL